ncbi:ATP-binding protein [Nonomuraea sp. NPDC050691]|uniref:sensor histidine kinase n=1 Tax=Nonomuraea sp. NPDC050691 TaxID=3155661 RepID=UPI0033EA4529
MQESSAAPAMSESCAGSSAPVGGLRTVSGDRAPDLPAMPADRVPDSRPASADRVPDSQPAPADPVQKGHLTGGAERHPQPTLADLDRLLDESRALGVVVTRHDEGETRPLTSTVERTAYRVVQEALTNAHKHAGDTRIDVFVRYLPADLEVVVRNTAPSASGRGLPGSGGTHWWRPGAGVPGSGWGLVGLRERVELAGGSLAAGPHFVERTEDGLRRDADAGVRAEARGEVMDGAHVEEGPAEQARGEGGARSGDQPEERVWDEAGFQVLARIPAP